MSELTKEKIYKNELEKVGGEGNNNLERIRSLAGGGGGSDNTFVVTFTDSGSVGTNGKILTPNKTFEEIYQAISSGKIVYGLFVEVISEDETNYYSQNINYCSKQYNGKTEIYEYFFSVDKGNIYNGRGILFSYAENEFEFGNLSQA